MAGTRIEHGDGRAPEGSLYDTTGPECTTIAIANVRALA